MTLLDRYKLGRLRIDDLIGQPRLVTELRQFLDAQCSKAFLFWGETGIGKTSAGYALADALGCDIDAGQLGGFHEIASGEMDGAAVRDAMRSLRLTPMYGSGWRLLIANEADYRSQTAHMIWLDALEAIKRQEYKKTVVIFTTNNIEGFEDRFRHRCTVLRLESETATLQPAIRRLARKIWHQEIGRAEVPFIESLGLDSIDGEDAGKFCSVRLAIEQLERYINEAKAHGVRKADFESAMIANYDGGKAYCDYCNTLQPVHVDATEHRCVKCGKVFQFDDEPQPTEA